MLSALVFARLSASALADGHSKWLGNIIASSVPANWDTYWNQATSADGCKWAIVQSGGASSFNWSECDVTYNHCQLKGIPFKYHTFLYGFQEPAFIASHSDQKGALLNFMTNAAARYKPHFVDVVNEPLHAPSAIRNALGGSGGTGWDWVVYSFEQARSLFGSSKLLINEYGIVNDSGAVQRYLAIINILKGKGLIDGIGIQCARFSLSNLAAATITANVNSLGATGLPVYPSQLEISALSEAEQAQIYQRVFPALWTNANVKGITIWGYIVERGLKEAYGLVDDAGREHEAMVWLKGYLASTRV